MEQFVDALPAITAHRVSSRCSQARANFQSRPIVSTDTPSSRADSATDSPANTRSSTTRALRSSTFARSVSASSIAEHALGAQVGDIHVERHDLLVAAALLIAALPRVVHEDEAHQLRGDRQEVRAVLPLHPALVSQAQVGLVDQGRRLDGVVRALAGQAAACQPFQLGMHERNDGVERLPIAAAPGAQKVGDRSAR